MTIQHHKGERNDEVLSIIRANPQLYDYITSGSFLHVDMYDVVDEDDLIAFFGVAHWSDEGINTAVMCYVYVKPDHRQQGIFNKMVKWFIKNNQSQTILAIAATKSNDLANEIYAKKFQYSYADNYGNWYLIKDKREN